MIGRLNPPAPGVVDRPFQSMSEVRALGGAEGGRDMGVAA
jgi:hypothetical protein